MKTKEERIREAVSRVRARGYAVASGIFGVGYDSARKKWNPQSAAGRCMCPLGALVVVEQPPADAGTAPAAASKLLGVEMRWVLCFSWAFDGHPTCPGSCEPCSLGARFREEIIAAEKSS